LGPVVLFGFLVIGIIFLILIPVVRNRNFRILYALLIYLVIGLIVGFRNFNAGYEMGDVIISVFFWPTTLSILITGYD